MGWITPSLSKLNWEACLKRTADYKRNLRWNYLTIEFLPHTKAWHWLYICNLKAGVSYQSGRDAAKLHKRDYRPKIFGETNHKKQIDCCAFSSDLWSMSASLLTRLDEISRNLRYINLSNRPYLDQYFLIWWWSRNAVIHLNLSVFTISFVTAVNNWFTTFTLTTKC
jgi:hypothetical protein